MYFIDRNKQLNIQAQKRKIKKAQKIISTKVRGHPQIYVSWQGSDAPRLPCIGGVRGSSMFGGMTGASAPLHGDRMGIIHQGSKLKHVS